jgi:hypothetical protein
MDSKSITQLLIIILIVFVLYIIFKKKSENMDNYNTKYCETPDNDDVTEDISEDYSVDYSFTGYDDINPSYEPKKSRPAPVVKKVKHCMSDKRLDRDNINVYYDSDDNRYSRNNVNKFIDEYVEYGRFTDVKDSNKKSPEKDFNKFRTNFFDFERKVTNTNSNGYDAVDRINEHNLDDKYFVGKNIGEIYDELTKPNFDTYKLE